MAAPTDGQLSAPVVRVAICAFLDILDDPQRVGIGPVETLSMPAAGASLLDTPDANFDGQTFLMLDPRFIDLSPVRHGAGGSESVRFTLSGTLELDADLLTALSDPAKFSGRLVQLWQVLLSDEYQPIAARPFYAGYMSGVQMAATPPDDAGHAQQVIALDTENYLAIVGSGAPARTLMWSPDPDDHAGLATIGGLGAASALGPGTIVVNGQTIRLPQLPAGIF